MATFASTTGSDSFRGSAASDVAYGGAGNDRWYGASGNDRWYGGTGNDLSWSGDGNDTALGGSGNDTHRGDDGSDYLVGDSGHDRLYGGNDADRLYGGSGNDELRGDAGKDTAVGATGNDRLYGGNDADRLLGDSGHDRAFGGYGNDSLYGGTGNDYLRGDAGDDRIEGGSGIDNLGGGLGADVFVAAARFGGPDRIADFRIAQGDALDLSRVLRNYDFGDDLAGFVRFTKVTGGTMVSIDPYGRGEPVEDVFLLAGSSLKGLTAAQLGLESLPDGMTLLSVDGDGDRDAGSGPAVMSGDGRFVAFQSSDAKAASDTDSTSDIYVRDMLTGEIVHASTSADGEGANRAATAPLAIAADGSAILFASNATNLDPDDTDGFTDLFWKELDSGDIARVNEKADGSRFNVSNADITGNGNYVVFETLESLVAGDSGGFDIYVRNMNSGAFARVSTTAGGGAPNGGSADPSISADGRHVAFTSLATNLVAGEPPGFDIFVKDLVTGELEWINRDSNGGAANADAQHAVISATGRYVVYESAATDLVAGDVDDGGTQLFWFDRVGGDTRRVSESADGDPANGFVLNADVSADGRFVVFESTANNLASGDDAGTRSDVFVKDMLTGDIAFVNRDDTGLDLTGTGNAFTGRQCPDISDDGQYVTFDGSGDVFFALSPLFPAPDLRDPDLIA